MTGLTVAVVLIAVLTLFNLFVLLGVIRRLRTMTAAENEPLPGTLPEVGRRVGPFALTSVDGGTVTEADLADGQSVVLLLSSTCLPCQGTAVQLAKNPAELPQRTYVFLRGDDNDAERDNMLETLAGVGTIATFDDVGGIGVAFGANGYPTALLVEDGVVAAASFKYAEVLPDRVSA